MADDPYTITIAGKTYEVDVDDLELGEIEIIEDVCDCAIADVDWGRMNATRAVVYVLLHREDAAFTMDDAKRVKVGALAEPEEPAKANGAKPRSRPTKAVADKDD